MYTSHLRIISTLYLVHYLLVTGAGDSPVSVYYSPIDDIAINCGSSCNSSAFDGREWMGDMGSKFTSPEEAKGKSSVSLSTTAHQSVFADPVPYMTARISRSQFTYTFQLRPGQKFIRLHFFPASYSGFERSKAFITVKAGPYTLLSNFSASLTADVLGVKYFAKEFCVNIRKNQVFTITFSASKRSETDDDDVYAFVNGIEIVSMPVGLYYTPDGDLGPHVVGNKFFRYYIHNNTALEMVHRLNVGGRSILSVEDLGMFRVWSDDKNYLLQSSLLRVSTRNMITYTNIPTYSAPLEVYQTAWVIGSNQQTNQVYNFTWELPVDLGFRYLVRLHFCELEPMMTESKKQFDLLINNAIVETDANVIKWSGGNGVAIYRDYVVMMEGDRMEGRRDLIIALLLQYESCFHNLAQKIDAILKGVEIFKLSNPDNNLAGVNPVFTAHATISSTPRLRKLVSAFGSMNTIAAGVILVLTLLNFIVYHLNCSESNSSKINISSSLNEEELHRNAFFSLDEEELHRSFSNPSKINNFVSLDEEELHRSFSNSSKTNFSSPLDDEEELHRSFSNPSKTNISSLLDEEEFHRSFSNSSKTNISSLLDKEEFHRSFSNSSKTNISSSLDEEELHRSFSHSSKINISSSLGEEELHRRFSLVEIQLATNNFDDGLLIGRGGFGNVYRGLIDKTKFVAIKRMNSQYNQGVYEFRAEIETLSKIRHNHLISLIGYCDDHREMILVYEYMAHGTLADHLHKASRNGSGNSPLSWEQRLNICIGAARGLDYLHTSSGTHHGIIHRDVKSSNILLDENWIAKICDFGLSKMDTADVSGICTVVKGSFGYLDPHYFRTQRLTKGSDVYSFGVVLFEVLCGRRPIETTLKREQINLADWAQHCIQKGTIDQIVDPSVKEQISPNCLRGFVKIANKCLHDIPNERPTMAKITARLLLIRMKLQGRAVINVDGASDQHVDSPSVSPHCSIPPMEVINENRVSENISPGRTENMELWKKKDYAVNQGWSLGWRLPFHRFSKTKAHPLPEVNFRRFSRAVIQSSTNRFNDRHLIRSSYNSRRRYYSKVYAGYMQKETKVAIKRFNRDYSFKWFCTELEVQSQLQCMNVVSLVGYCYDGHENDEMFLVHEYMANGNLFDRLHNTSNNNNNQPLSWKERLKICIGAARGLNYLHTGVEGKGKTIIHGEVMPHNILLDQNCVAKISDFDLSLLVCGDSEFINTMTVGVEFRYVDPEYIHTYRSTKKSDVYSFGVVLLEVLCAGKASSMKDMGMAEILSARAKECIKAGSVEEIIDPYLIGKISPLCLSEFVEIASKCVLRSGTKRPTMSDVVGKLELALQLQETADAALENEVINKRRESF